MKSQSSITARVFPNLVPRTFKNSGTWKNISYYCRYWSTTLTVVGIFIAVGSIMGGVAWAINNGNNNEMVHQSKMYHYPVGSQAKCNSVADQNIGNDNPLANGNGWFTCKIVAVSKSNEYYTTSYFNPSSHKTETYKFQIQYVSNQ